MQIRVIIIIALATLGSQGCLFGKCNYKTPIFIKSLYADINTIVFHSKTWKEDIDTTFP